MTTTLSHHYIILLSGEKQFYHLYLGLSLTDGLNGLTHSRVQSRAGQSDIANSIFKQEAKWPPTK